MNRLIVLLVLSGIWAAGVTSAALSATAQRARMDAYEDRLEDRIEARLETFRLRRLEEARAEMAESPREPPETTTRGEKLDESLIDALSDRFESTVNLYESRSGEGQDVEIRLTMPITEFMKFAPIAALEAAAIPHKFPVVYIFVREETTDRVARVAFKDAEPIAGRYLANDEDAVEEMNEALVWH